MNSDTPSSSAAEPQAPPEVSIPSERSLRRRKQSTRRLSYVLSTNGDPADTSKGSAVGEAQESVFLNMYIRKMHRRIRGKQSNDSLCCEFVVVIIMLVVILALGWDTTDEGDWEEADTIGLVVFLLWIILAMGMFFVFGDSPYVKMLRYMIVYIPLIFFMASLSFHEEVRKEGMKLEYTLLPQQYWILALAIVAEVLVFASFMSYYKLCPKMLQSKWFRSKPGRVQKFWGIKAIVADDAWTMSYRGHNPNNGAMKSWQWDYSCKYEGDIDPSTGLPDGLGRWLDDSYEGEMLTGYWKQGEPVAPFSSWSVGSDDAIVAVRVAYFKATDDDFSKNKFFPTNQDPPECGVAAVECSVSGSFYKHLPCATLIEGPYPADILTKNTLPENNPIREVLSNLIQVGEAEDGGHIDKNGASSIHILATDPSGIQVLGHAYEPTGRFYYPNAKSITVDVEWGTSESNTRSRLSKRQSARVLQKTLFMPKAATQPLSKLVEVEVDDSSVEESSDDDEVPLGTDDNGVEQQSAETETGQRDSQRMATLRVRDWVPCLKKEALIFCPGYNSCMQASLKNIGQFLAMTKLTVHLYPFVFVWPGSKNVGYAYASKISATETNYENMLKLVRGLKEAGITRCHFLSHSMGVQTLLGSFKDVYDESGNYVGRSEVSKLFTLDPAFDEAEGPREGKREQFTNKLVCKSITLLNPDFPLKAFVDRAFLSIRRVCKTITVVGDRNDRALGWSSFINGAAPRFFGYEQPEVLRPNIISSKPPKFEFMERIGRSVEELYFPAEVGQQYHDSGNESEFRRLLFNKAASSFCGGKINGNNSNEDRFWLDVDVIDMTGLDTNIKDMRHSGFSLNPMLLKDLQELFSTGKRAMKRSTLLYREGNQFSFAHAPAFVSQ